MQKYPWSRPDIRPGDSFAVAESIKSTWVSGGPEIELLSNNLSEFLGSPNVVLVSNGTTALAAAFLALDLEPGDEVIVPAFGFMAAANVLLQQRLVPVFADVNINTWCLDLENIQKRISKKTKAVVVTHTYGNSDFIDEITEYLGNNLGIPVIEDTAEALGSSLNGKKLGTFGEIGTLSFHATKLITTGEGGAILSKSHDLASKLRLLISHGLDRKDHYSHRIAGTNFRMPNICAALGNSQFSRIESYIDQRKKIDQMYRSIISDTSIAQRATFQSLISDEIVPWSFPLALNGLDPERIKSLETILSRNSIEIRPGFKTPNSLPYMRHLTKPEFFPVAYNLANTVISLPAYPYLDESDIELICHNLELSLKGLW